MKISDALSILGVTGEYTPEIIKQAYRKACSTYHPDRNPAGLEMMKMVNQAYDVLRGESGIAQEVPANDAMGYGEEIFNALSKIINLGFDIEICGSWVWLHGDTRPHKDIIKEAGLCGHLKRNYGTTVRLIINPKVAGSFQWMKYE